MAKRKLTLADLQEEFEAKLMAHIAVLEDEIAERFEIDCWDACLDGAVWNKNVTSMAKMWVNAIVSDRDWASKGDTDWKVMVDYSTALKRKELERTIRRAERELAELE